MGGPGTDGDRCFPTEKGIVCLKTFGPIFRFNCQDLDDLWESKKGDWVNDTYSALFFEDLKRGCPKGAGSIDMLAEQYKAHQEKLKKARGETQKTVESYRRRCPPATFDNNC